LLYDTCESGTIVEDRLGFRDIQQGVAADKLSKSMGRTVLSHGVMNWTKDDRSARAN
jgi:hypothetical protein